MDEKTLKKLADAYKQGNPEAKKAIDNLKKLAQGQGEEAEKAKSILTAIQGYIKKAAKGAKLDYIKSLKHQCPEGEELYYYKKGGSVGCGCKKKEDGGEVVKANMGIVADFKEDQKKKKQQQKPQQQQNSQQQQQNSKWTDEKDKELKKLSEKKILTPQDKQRLQQLRNEFKKSSNAKNYELEEGKKGMKVEKDCGSSVIKKFKIHRQGGSLNGIPFYQEGGKNKKSINDYYLTDYSEPNIQQKAKLNGKELTIKVNKGQQKGEDPITIQGNNYYLKGDSTLVKDNSIPYSFEQLRNSSINKKYNGGSLNRLPFYQGGTPKGGINGRGISGEYYYNPVPQNAIENIGYFPLIDFYNAIEEKSKTTKNPFIETGIVNTPGGPGGAARKLISLGKPFKTINGVNYYKNAAGELKTAQEMAKELAAVKNAKSRSWFPREHHTDHYVPKNATGIYNELEKATYEGEQMMKNPFADWRDFDEMNSVNYWKRGGFIKK